MKYLIQWTLAMAASAFGVAVWSAPSFFIENLKVEDSLEDFEQHSEQVELWRKLTFLCQSGAPSSLNPHCYELAKMESKAEVDSISERFPIWWESQCADHFKTMSWRKLRQISWQLLPEGCQHQWHQRQEELIYRHSQEDLDLLWQNRH